MRPATRLPVRGEALLDARGDTRALQASWHPEAGVVVLSLWRHGTCVGTFRLAVEDAPALIRLLAGALADGPADGHGAAGPGGAPADLAG
jgi:hypothetical protein